MTRAKSPPKPIDLTTETDLKARITKAVKAIPGVKAWRNNAGRVKVRGGWMQLGETGSPDILVFTSKSTGGFEVKRPGVEQDPDQIRFQSEWEALGNWYMVVSTEQQAVDKVLMELR